MEALKKLECKYKTTPKAHLKSILIRLLCKDENTPLGNMLDGISSYHHNDVSEIQNYFTGKNVFVTGATGFLGKLIIEKLLRTCNVKKIYVLVREKKGKEPRERLKELFDIPAFVPLKKQTPDFIDKILVCAGDCLKPNLGLCQEDIDLLKNEVNCILHCAATVRFDASLREATYINIRAVLDLIRMAKGMKQLTSFIHVSTAYTQCPREDIDEKIYEPPIKGQKLMNLVEALNDDVLDAITPTLLDQWPNTYAFTKAIAEDVVKNEGKGLPISVLKPSIIISSFKEPLPGWIDSVNGLIGLLIAWNLGLLRTLLYDKSTITDVVPADYVVNAMLAAAWNTGRRRIVEIREDQGDSIVYNCVSGCQNPIKFSYYMKQTKEHSSQIPSTMMIWHIMFFPTTNLYLYLLYEFFLHTIPAYIVDFVLLCMGKKLMLVNGYKKIGKFSKVMSYFSTRQWNFKDTNLQNLWSKLNPRDRELFQFDIKGVDWDEFIKSYTLGIRIYLLKDPLDTLPQAKRRLRIIKIAHYTLLTALFVLLVFLIKIVFS